MKMHTPAAKKYYIKQLGFRILISSRTGVSHFNLKNMRAKKWFLQEIPGTNCATTGERAYQV